MLLLLTSGAFAQFQSEYSDGQNHIGFNLGYSDALMRERTGSKDSLNYKLSMQGFKAGLVYETTFVKGFGVQFGLNYTFGAKLGKKTADSDVSTFKGRDNYFIHQLEMPIDWQYKFEVAKETYVLVYTGPTIQVGLGFCKKSEKPTIVDGKPGTGVQKTDYYKQRFDDGKGGNDKDQDGIEDRYKRLNITWGVGAGFQYKRYFLRAGYDFGIYNPYTDRIYNYSSDEMSNYYYRARLDQWSVKLGMYLWNF